jgi:hypothetical protein
VNFKNLCPDLYLSLPILVISYCPMLLAPCFLISEMLLT